MNIPLQTGLNVTIRWQDNIRNTSKRTKERQFPTNNKRRSSIILVMTSIKDLSKTSGRPEAKERLLVGT